MSHISLTFDNHRVQSFFSNKNNDPPVAELLYIHSHPNVANFVSELEILIGKANIHLKEHPRKAGVVQKLAGMTEKFGAALGEMNEERATRILFLMRDIYTICDPLSRASKDST